MSPVSRGRRPKKGGKRKTARRMTDAERVPAGPFGFGGGARPAWFDGAIDRVLAGAEVLTEAGDSRTLDQLTAELIGAPLYEALQGGRGLRFHWWLEDLVEATIERVERGDAPGREAAVRLLHGLTAHGVDLPADLLHRARNPEGNCADGAPGWLAGLPRLHATGEVRRLRDVWGTRFGVIAEFAHPADAGSAWYLWDVDASGFVLLVDAGVFDDAEQAAAAWRADVGEPETALDVVTDPAQLRCLTELDISEMSIRGNERRRVMDNWFRADARIGILARTLRTRGRPLPPRESLYRGIDVTVLTGPFSDWHVHTHGDAPDSEVVEALAVEWMEGALPETWFSASPARIRFQHELIGDWIQDDPVTRGVLALLPEWVRWLGERSGLAADRVQTLVDTARETPRRALSEVGR